MTINGNLILLGRWLFGGLAGILISVFGWLPMKADTKVERHEMRIQAVELSNMRIETKLDYMIKSIDELKLELRSKP